MAKKNVIGSEDGSTRKDLLVQSLRKHLGIVTNACSDAGCSRSTFYEYYNSDPEFKKAVDECKEIAIDHVESALHYKIDLGDTNAIVFYLKTQGKSRGYVEKTQQEISGSLKVDELDYTKLSADELKVLISAAEKLQHGCSS